MAKTLKIEELDVEFEQFYQFSLQNDVAMTVLRKFTANMPEDERSVLDAYIQGVDAVDAAELTADEEKALEKLQRQQKASKAKRKVEKKAEMLTFQPKIAEIDQSDEFAAIQANMALNQQLSVNLAVIDTEYDEKDARITANIAGLKGKAMHLGKATRSRVLGDKKYADALDITEKGGSQKFSGVYVCNYGKASGMSMYRVETNELHWRLPNSTEFVKIGQLVVKTQSSYQRMHFAVRTRFEFDDTIKGAKNALEVAKKMQEVADWVKFGLNVHNGRNNVRKLTVSVTDDKFQQDVVQLQKECTIPDNVAEMVEEWIKVAGNSTEDAGD